MTAILTRRRTGSAILGLLVVAIIALTGFVASSVAGATGFPAVPAPPASPTMANQIQNIDQVKTAIKGYYGDTPSAGIDPTNGQPTTLHFASPTSAYANELAGIEAKASARLAQVAQKSGTHRAIVLDVDDTSLNTYSYEIYSNFVYNPVTNGAFVTSGIFPAVFGMPQLATDAASEGYTVFYLTGRPEAQRAATEANLANVGFPVVDSQVYLKDQTQPWLSSCAPTCTTIQYKSLTRQHIESLGYTIIGNFGDQYSDLTGGFAQQTYKLPNPMYYLP